MQLQLNWWKIIELTKQNPKSDLSEFKYCMLANRTPFFEHRFTSILIESSEGSEYVSGLEIWLQ